LNTWSAAFGILSSAWNIDDQEFVPQILWNCIIVTSVIDSFRHLLDSMSISSSNIENFQEDFVPTDLPLTNNKVYLPARGVENTSLHGMASRHTLSTDAYYHLGR